MTKANEVTLADGVECALFVIVVQLPAATECCR
ncbi:MAG: hypothetical protein RIQ71_1119 [Verrucomicrobiota bacterium]